ncbi:CapA family protein [Streptomyces melanosporofaciens]|uniref:Poly-gamma-glutamate synthesis protein (Capsule biosynthesis protein) n=1 Tax=Streptomyces melanosporofaciens TaxID=67327 RepID=A0A1H4Z6S6_STRMJ|nr:CapA family protein [Streptomyces melanosporofaciens]SED25081.1 poly-gamma-glutamate synthesis protein (capsule biosynthesis protein) [Streptomyces melanosporofaciens]
MKLIAVGDVVVARRPAVGCEGDLSVGTSALPLLRDADLVIGNLEVPLTDAGYPAEKAVAFRVGADMAPELARLGFDACSLATNHALDYGIEGLRSTRAALDQAGVAHAGAGENLDEALRAAHLTGRGRTEVAFVSLCCALPPGFNATSHRPGIAAVRVEQAYEFDGVLIEEQPGTVPYVRSHAREADVVRAEEAVRRARDRAATVVVALHWGVPWCYLPSNQGPLAEYQRPLGRRLVDAGADLVIGHHPHCLHPVERYGDGLILYSTGNFLFHPSEEVSPCDRRPPSRYKERMFDRPWFESAVFEVTLAEGPPGLRLHPIELTAHGEPVIPSASTARRILRQVEEASQELAPSMRVDELGRVHF